MDIIQYLLSFIQYQHQQICWLLNFICRYIPLKQWAFDDSHSPKYQKFKVDELPVIKTFIKQDWQFLLEYYQWKYHKPLKPVQRRNGKCIPEDTVCPLCGAPHHFIYDNNGSNGQYQCKVCGQTFSTGDSTTTPMRFLCPHCGHTLVPKKDRKFFRKHKCVNPKCPYYLHNLAKVERKDLKEEHGKTKYKLHYIYREFTVDFFAMDLNSLPKNASSLKFSKHNAHVMSLCLTLHINLGLSLRKTSQALKDLYNISISHQQIANYCKTAASCIKPFVDHWFNDCFHIFRNLVGINIITATFLSSTDHPKEAFLLSIFRGFVLVIPMAFLLSYLFGINGIWMTLPITELIVMIPAVYFIKRVLKKFSI